MKNMFQYSVLIFVLASLVYGCEEDKTDNPKGNKNVNSVDVQVILPEGANADLSGASLFTLGSASDLEQNQSGELPFNVGSVELAYLMDNENNVLLTGFITDNRKEISVETTVEVMLYFALDYYLLPDNAKDAYLAGVQQVPGFSELVNSIEDMFVSDPLMYVKGTYLPKIKEKIDEISEAELKRIYIDGEDTKSGITIAKIDADHVKLQNSFPRRTKVFVYKKLYYDRDGNLHEISNYTNNPVMSFDFEPGERVDIETLEVGSKLSQVGVQSGATDNISETEAIELPVNTNSEFLAEYEIVVIGAGELNSIGRNLTDVERKSWEDLNVKTYALDYLLPTLLDIGGNKGLLPPFGSNEEDALLNAVLPALEANPDILEDIKNNEFKSASQDLLPELYGDIRLSNNLRDLLTEVYKIISNNGNMPNTFVQSQELIETGYARMQVIMDAIYRNMNLDAKVNIQILRTEARSFEIWSVNSIDAVVNLSPQEVEVCLEEATPIKVSYITFTDPDVEEVEYHWSVSNNFGGRVQDINDNPNNFGVSIITKSNEVSYISTALESELGSGDNFETVTVTIYAKNKNTGELSEIGGDEMQVNNKKGCASFYVSFTKEVRINEFTSLLCNGDTEYSIGHPTYVAEFEAVDGAQSYKGRVKRKDGAFGNEFTLSNIEDLGGGMLKFRLGVGSIVLYSTCNASDAEEEKQKRLDYLDEVGHQGIEIRAVF